MEKRYFEFESIVTKDESENLKIDLGSEIDNGMRFSVKFQNIMFIKSIFQFISYLTTMKSAPYDRTMIDYKDWYANEIIRRVTKDDKFFNQQSDAKKDVLKELLQRRNKLQNQIEKAINYYDENKARIDEMEKIRANNQKSFLGPMLISTDNYLVFENINEYGDIYYKLCIKLPNQSNILENTLGYGWMEYSKSFSEEVSNIRALKGNEVILTNSKPRSDIRVIRRSDSKPLHLFTIDSRMRAIAEQTTLINWLLYNNSEEFVISKSNFYSLVDKITNNYKQNDILSFNTTSHEQPFTIRTTEEKLILKFQKEPDTVQKRGDAKFNSSIFFAIKPLIYLVDTVKFLYYGPLFGVIFQIHLGENELLIQSNVDHSREYKYLRGVYLNYIRQKNNKDDLLLGGNYNFTPDNQLYKREFVESSLNTETREEFAFELIKFFSQFFKIEEDIISFESEDIVSFLKKNEETGHLTWNCSCQGFNDIFKCRHSIACFYLSIEEGW